MIRRFLTLLYCILFCLSLVFTTSSAKECATLVQESDKLFQKSTAHISFPDRPSLFSNKTREIIEDAEKTVSEISFTVDAGNTIFSLGYCLKSKHESFESILSQLSLIVESLNEDIASSEYLRGNNCVSLAELKLNYVNYEINDLLLISTPQELSNYSNILISPTLLLSSPSYAIDSSYHRLSGSGGIIYWYNHGAYAGTCSTSTSSPHLGDGNNRFSTSYSWYPTYANVTFTTGVSTGTNYNRTMLQFKYDSSYLNNLVVDTNETLEVEVQFYNYIKIDTSYEERGHYFQCPGSIWISNIPSAYLDTTFLDSTNVVSLCVGCSDASQLVANTYYYWRIDSAAGITSDNYPNDGRFRIVAQRGYRLLGNGTWNVFSEEHDNSITLGINSQYKWVPAINNAWILAQNNQTWCFDDFSDPIRIT